ncbi:phosphodiester glycosidase family protein [Hymenobacter sp. ASUV-10]|uniref:Phosphodiester glycosidase family protein n=1 Tax=Hymenobacter aranciens TaxID=3063996 RepID=A0ABT9BA18_9BACT|nr:phosphodiester glycosidase family protein [Hymenobacter sp. ASUV-10]MDO7873882.1 phosphodiester glycosidase family protein [Hymenobacter sp. ASUV-10]
MLLGLVGVGLWARQPRIDGDAQVVAYEVDLQKQQLELFWKDDNGQLLSNIQRLKDWLQGREQQLIFAANAGMFNPQHAPQGLFIQNFKTISPLDTGAGRGNFYLRPNGVFYTTADGRAGVCTTGKFVAEEVKFATQSGPMLVIDGQIHPAFSRSSTNLNIRNGVGILPNGHALFAMSKGEVSFYTFAKYFADRGCRNALYLDGAISRTYCPTAGWVQTDGIFGVMVGVTQPLQRRRK